MTDWLTTVGDLGCGAVEAALDGTITATNARMIDWLGRDPTGGPLGDLLEHGAAAFWSTTVQPLIALQGEAYDVAIALDTPGEKTWVLAFARLRNDTLRSLFVPFNQRQRYEQAIREAQKRDQANRTELARLDELDRLRAEFLNSISHELNTPLTPLLLALRTVKALVQEAEAKAALDRMQRSVDRIVEFNDSVVTAARLQLRNWNAPRSELELESVVQAALQARSAPGKPTIQVAGPGGTGCANEEALRDCIERLVSNCDKFCPPTASVTIRVEPGTIVIQDTGPGIRPEKLKHVGKPFAKAHQDTDNAQLGAGLGLFIVHAQMAAMGGTLHMASGETGTTATLRMRTKCTEGS